MAPSLPELEEHQVRRFGDRGSAAPRFRSSNATSSDQISDGALTTARFLGISRVNRLNCPHLPPARRSSDRFAQLRPAMLRILGSKKRLCDGMTRREMLQAGASGLLGLGLGDLAPTRADSYRPSKFSFRACQERHPALSLRSSQPDRHVRSQAPTPRRGSRPLPLDRERSCPASDFGEHLPAGPTSTRSRDGRPVDHDASETDSQRRLAVTGIRQDGRSDGPLERGSARHLRPFFGSVIDYASKPNVEAPERRRSFRGT